MSEEVQNNEELNNNEEKTTKKNHKGLRRSLIAISLAVIISVCGSIVKTYPQTIDDELDDLIDDILDLDETVGVVNIKTGEVEEMQVEDAVKMLEDITIDNKKIKELNIKGENLNELDELRKAAALKIYKDNGIDTVIELYNDSDNSKIDKARIAQQLLYIEDTNNKWLETNGVALSQSLLKRVISAGMIDAYGTFKPNEYTVVDLNNVNNGVIKEVILKDEISGAEDSIKLLPILTDEYYDALNLYQVIIDNEYNEKEYSLKEIKDLVSASLNASKRCVNKELVDNGVFSYTKKI